MASSKPGSTPAMLFGPIPDGRHPTHPRSRFIEALITNDDPVNRMGDYAHHATEEENS